MRIQALNGDTTFLLTFSPPFAPAISKRHPGDFIILLDPWLRGHSSILHPSFQISHHTSTPALYSLNELDQRPDLIIISQDKSDHCHKATLCTLPPDTEISILATPAGVKKIKSWKYFDEDVVQAILPYSSADPDSVIRIPLPAPSESSADGEITIANVPTKRDVTGVHNAIGITYRAATTVLSTSLQYPRQYTGFSSVTLPERGFSSAPASRHRSRGFSSAAQSADQESIGFMSVPELPQIPARFQTLCDTTLVGSERVLSVVYTPHGVTHRTLESYLLSHLSEMNALPLCALIHSLNIESNPWFMGGLIANGAPGGVDLLKQVQAKYWIGAHDEAKDNRGMATKLLKTQYFDIEDVEEMLSRAGVSGIEVIELNAGEVLTVPEATKTFERARKPRKKQWKKGLRMGKGQRMNVEDNVLAMPEPKRPVTAPNLSNGAVAPGTKLRIRREIIDPEGRWI